jgi:hypothetical protein
MALKGVRRFEGLEPTCDVVGGDGVIKMRPELVVRVAALAFDVSPGMSRLGSVVTDVVHQLTDGVREQNPILQSLTIAPGATN